MKLPLFIARRYLFAHRSQNVINIVSAISAAGMAVGTAALVIILSIYNGFDALVKSMMGSVEPDLLVSVREGKYFTPSGEACDWLYENGDVASVCTVLQDQVFLSYGGQQGVAVCKGVDEIYAEETPLKDNIRRGEFSLHRGDVPLACVGTGLARKMGMNPSFLTPIIMYYPSGEGGISVVNPAAGLESVKVWPSGIFSVNNDVDDKTLIVPIETMTQLLGLDGGEVSGVEIRLRNGGGDSGPGLRRSGLAEARKTRQIQKQLSERLGEAFSVRDRFQQNESLYRMMKYEKTIIFLILIFVIIVISFNIFGSLTMLTIEKREDVATLRALGGNDALIRRIFTLEGWMVSLLGMAAGMLVGIGVALLQQHFGFVRMPGNFTVSAYPVIIEPGDIALITLCIAAIGFVTALIPAIRATKGQDK